VGSPRARKALKAADGRAESPGETWARLAVADLHPGHEVQFSVYDPSGAFVARADGGWPSLGLIWEYDGQGKYEELRPLGMTREDVVAKQVRRQSKLERLSWTVIRAGGEDLPYRDVFRARVSESVWAVGKADWAPPRGRIELMQPLTVDVRRSSGPRSGARRCTSDGWPAERDEASYLQPVGRTYSLSGRRQSLSGRTYSLSGRKG
jgi:hypothetical protein